MSNEKTQNGRPKTWLDAARETLDWTWENVTDEALNHGFSTYDPEAKERDARKATIEALDQAYAEAWEAIEAEENQISARVTVEKGSKGGIQLRVFFRVGRNRCAVRLWHPGVGDFGYMVVPDAGGAVPDVWPNKHPNSDGNTDQHIHTQPIADSDAHVDLHAQPYPDSAPYVDLQPHT